MSSYLVFDHKTNYCAMNKLFPAERFQTFNIWHCTYKPHESFKSVYLILHLFETLCVIDLYVLFYVLIIGSFFFFWYYYYYCK